MKKLLLCMALLLIARQADAIIVHCPPSVNVGSPLVVEVASKRAGLSKYITELEVSTATNTTLGVYKVLGPFMRLSTTPTIDSDFKVLPTKVPSVLAGKVVRVTVTEVYDDGTYSSGDYCFVPVNP